MTASFYAHAMIALCLMAGVADAGTEELQSVKQRMGARLEILTELKSRGEIGENCRGYVEERSSAHRHSTILAEENADRATVYRAIAAKQNADPAEVGRLRARRIAETCASGTWIQSVDGVWRRR